MILVASGAQFNLSKTGLFGLTLPPKLLPLLCFIIPVIIASFLCFLSLF